MKTRTIFKMAPVVMLMAAVLLAACQPSATPSPAPSPTTVVTVPPAQAPKPTPSPAPPTATPKPPTPAPTPQPTTPPPPPPATPEPTTPAAVTSPPPPATSPPAKPPTPPVAKAPPPGAVTQANFTAANVNFTGKAGDVKAYEVRPNGSGPFPAMIVIHENRGIVEHTRDVARRFANQGYVAVAIDLLSRVGGREKFTTDTEATAALNTLTPDGVAEDLQSAVDYLKTRNYVKADRIGVIGYCWGGGSTLVAATRIKEIRASVPYYGPNPRNIDDVANITGPVLGIYGEADQRINAGIPALEGAMKKYNKSFEYKIYPAALHAFFNDTGGNYNPQAAAEAWTLTLAFLEKHLKS
ncbi:MAG: dienelactone hydrolase family protein [Chloroflexi bacterium]|nr:dienelactone hydrolase family protein [Chloroflexota bacterium]